MVRTGRRLWRRVPGYGSDSDSDSDDEDEDHDEDVSDAGSDASIEEAEESSSGGFSGHKERLAEVVKSLGGSYDDGPCINFTSVFGRPVKQFPLASRWSIGMGPRPPGFRIERVHAPLVRETFMGNGFRPAGGEDWLIRWSGPRMRGNIYQGLHQYQRVNHFPSSTELTRKDKLWEHFHRTAVEIGEDLFDFVPETFVLPEESSAFKKCYKKHRGLWIVKPSASSQGKGIFLLKDLSDLPTNSQSFVVSRYISNPLLIQGLKFDLRIYVLVTSFDPLRAFIYREGLTRFASKPYNTDEASLGDSFVHLTNYSINKSAENFQENQRIQADNYGHKWSLSALNRHLRCVGCDVKLMWERIMDLIVKTLLSVEPIIAKSTHEVAPHPDNCFELYGFDVLVDEDLKPWLLEVNLSPSMQADSPLDKQIKSSLLSDAFNLVGVRIPDAQQTMHSRLKTRMMQLDKIRASAASAGRPPRPEAAARPKQTDKDDEFPADINDDNLPEELVEAGPPRQKLLGKDGRWKAVKLNELDGDELRLLARSLEEFDRCSNFIHLYPTRGCVKQYAPITKRRARAAAFRGRLLAAALFGPKPVCPAQQHGSGERQSRAVSAPAAATTGPVGELLDGEDFQEDDDVEESEEDEATMANFKPPGPFDSSAADSALLILKVLGSKLSFALVLMEYLVRVHNICIDLTPAERKRISGTSNTEGTESDDFQQDVSSKANAYAGVRAFRRQLSVHLRTRGCQAPVLDHCDLADELIAVSRLAISRLFQDCWAGGAVTQELPPLQCEPGRELSIMIVAPPAFVKSASGCRAVNAVAGLESSSLEHIIRSPAAPVEFRSLLEMPSVFELQWPRAGALLRRRIQESSGNPVGPLSDLERLQALAGRARKREPPAPPPPPAQHSKGAQAPRLDRLAYSRSAPLLSALKQQPGTPSQDLFRDAVANLPSYLRPFAARLPPLAAGAKLKSLRRPASDGAKLPLFGKKSDRFHADEIEL